MIYNDIRSALESYLAATSGIPDIAWANVPYETDPEIPFIKTTLVPTSRRPAVVGPSPQQRYNGLFSLLICTPENNGSFAGYDYADLLCERFDATTDIPNGSLVISIDYAEVGASYYDPPYFCTPVTVGWHTYN